MLLANTVNGHETEKVELQQAKHQTGEVTYLGNAGLMVSHGEQQILFDPFFHTH